MKQSKIKITFHATVDQECIALAELGLSTNAICEATDLTVGQVNYRIHRDRVLCGREIGLRAEWRSGSSPLFASIRNDMIDVLRHDVEKRLAPLLTPNTIKKR